jgi:hypothetical protein
VTVTVWIVVGANRLTVQRLWVLLAGTLARVHELLESAPAVAVHAMLPAGLLALPLAVSVTVAVHVLAPPIAMEEGEQLTAVDVLRLTVKVWEFELPPAGAGLKTV